MKRSILSLLTLSTLMTSICFATGGSDVENGSIKIIKAKNNITIAPSRISSVKTLVDKLTPEGGRKIVNLLIKDNGMSTDLSPRYQVYLTYSNLAEMGNMYSTFLISDAALEVVSSKRIDAGIYEVIVKEYRPDQSENIYNATYTINTINMFKAEDAMRKKCGGDFCDGNIEAEISAKVNIQK